MISWRLQHKSGNKLPISDHSYKTRQTTVFPLTRHQCSIQTVIEKFAWNKLNAKSIWNESEQIDRPEFSMIVTTHDDHERIAAEKTNPKEMIAFVNEENK